jgi:hypothetical protein
MMDEMIETFLAILVACTLVLILLALYYGARTGVENLVERFLRWREVRKWEKKKR